jgi:hypothetical protein
MQTPPAVQDALDRVRSMARSGLYKGCAAIEQELRNHAVFYPLLRQWFADELFCGQINELCHGGGRAF